MHSSVGRGYLAGGGHSTRSGGPGQKPADDNVTKWPRCAVYKMGGQRFSREPRRNRASWGDR